ncbi:nucleoid-associated protein [Aerococcaceae bacterium zg-ZJ1578]|uniref:nucleoid-associated protein n=1 Tax=Aerococcaceae bacterium zg-252 TaxID=2796928 RepID=UPI001A1DB3CC|nr:nucleoid-associated protein [Aerococcaceae bacterium zg-1578]
MLSIKQAILHILDKNSGNLLLSDQLMNLEDGYVQDYINRLVVKIQKSDVQFDFLSTSSKLYARVLDEQTDFIDLTRDIAQQIYSIIAPAEQIPAADYLFFEGKDELEEVYFGILRLDYQTSFTHYLEMEDGVRNQLIQNHAILPAPTQKTSEAFILNRATMRYELVEKRYEIEGQKIKYFSEQIIGIEPPAATPTHIKQIRKTVNSVAKRFDEPSYEVMAMAQKVIYEQLDESNEIDADSVIERVFEHNEGAKAAAKEEISEKHVPEKIVVTNVPKYEKKYSMQKFKLANGIELSIPIDLYDNKDIIEFVNQPDGSISVIIKNVEAIVNKFNG